MAFRVLSQCRVSRLLGTSEYFADYFAMIDLSELITRVM